MGSAKANIPGDGDFQNPGNNVLGAFLWRNALRRCGNPPCLPRVRQMAYATFSILQVYDDRTAYLVEFDNPGCIFIRTAKL